MLSTCSSPLPWSTLVGYWLADPQIDADDVEEHLFGCAACSQSLAGLAGLTRVLRQRFSGNTLQPVVTREALNGLVAGGMRVIEVVVPRGERRTVSIPGNVDLLVARLLADVADATRLDVELCAPDRVPLFVVPNAPFDAGSGEVLLLCHRDTAASNPELLVRLVGTFANEQKVTTEYVLESTIA